MTDSSGHGVHAVRLTQCQLKDVLEAIHGQLSNTNQSVSPDVCNAPAHSGRIGEFGRG